jgi:alcohol dehydrogenase
VSEAPVAESTRRSLAEFVFRSGPRLVVGPGRLRELGSLVREHGGSRVLLASDRGVIEAGHVASAEESLATAGVESLVFSEFGENPVSTAVEAGTAVAREFRPDLLVGLGGGSSMDMAKGINFLLSCGGRMQAYKGRATATAPMLPSIGVPTTAGTGSETQSFALITDADTGMKMACGDPAAAFRVAILDVNLTLTQPRSLVAIGGIDAVAHAVESHVSLAATPASRVFSREAWRLLAMHLPTVFGDDGSLEARAAVQWAAALAGLAIENSMLGAAHALANPLTATHGLTHGRAVGLLLPHVVRFNAPVVGELYAELLAASDTPAAASLAGDLLAARLTALLLAGNLAATLTAAGIAAPRIEPLAAGAAEQWTARFNPREVTATDLAQLYEAAR